MSLSYETLFLFGADVNGLAAADQGVDIKVISGDNALTVSHIAKKAGLENLTRVTDEHR